MGLDFQFATASKIIFGRNSVEKVPALLAETGENLLLVTGKSNERMQCLTERLPGNFNVTVFPIPDEPTVQMINEGVKTARNAACNVVVGFGGGSAIDSAKAIAALVPNRGELPDYLEVIGKGKKLQQSPLPCIAIPTTSGTGAEVTKNSVIKSPEHKVKVSLRSELMYPKVAVVDPVLAVSMPPDITATTGVDALTHLLETFVSSQSNPFIDLFCREGIQRISRSLVNAYKHGDDLEAREDMALAGLLGGMALANVKLGAVHGFAGPMGGMFSAPHGAICASLLPAVMEVNLAALAKKQDTEKLLKYDELARLITGRKQAVAQDGAEWLRSLAGQLQIPGLGKFGLNPGDFETLAGKAKVASSMKGNPVLLNDEQLMTILEKSM